MSIEAKSEYSTLNWHGALIVGCEEFVMTRRARCRLWWVFDDTKSLLLGMMSLWWVRGDVYDNILFYYLINNRVISHQRPMYAVLLLRIESETTWCQVKHVPHYIQAALLYAFSCARSMYLQIIQLTSLIAPDTMKGMFSLHWNTIYKFGILTTKLLLSVIH